MHLKYSIKGSIKLHEEINMSDVQVWKGLTKLPCRIGIEKMQGRQKEINVAIFSETTLFCTRLFLETMKFTGIPSN